MHLNVLILFFVIALLLTEEAHANCAFLNNYNTDSYNILNVWEAKHVNDEHFKGCLAKIYSDKSGELIVYISYNFICKSKRKTHEMDILQACCDTGRHGDYSCGVIPKKTILNELDSDAQINLTAVPVSKGNEKLIVKELIDRLETGAFYGSASMVDRIVSIAEQEGGQSFIKPHIKKLKKMMSSKDQNISYNAAQILNTLSGISLKKEIYLTFLKQGYLLKDGQKREALNYFSSNPESLSKDVIEAIVSGEALNERGEARDQVLSILGHLSKEDLEPFLEALYAEIDPYDMQKEAGYWQELVCKVYHDKSSELTEVKLKVSYDKFEYIQCYN